MRKHEIYHLLKNEAGGFYDPAEVLEFLGAELQAVLSVPKALAEAMAREGRVLPQPVNVRALIDTGCTRTAFDSGIAAALQLPQTGTGRASTANGVCDVTFHPIHVFFPELGAGVLLPQARACNMRAARVVARD